MLALQTSEKEAVIAVCIMNGESKSADSVCYFVDVIRKKGEKVAENRQNHRQLFKIQEL